MEAFNAAYPWMVLSIGIFDATVFALTGVIFWAIAIVGKYDVIANRLPLPTIIFAMFSGLSVGALAFTHWLLLHLA
jgi:hypothetical protein